MLQGICIDPGQTVVLEKGKNYFLFPNGTQHYYVSKFPNKHAYKGCFQTKYFQIIQKEEWSNEPDVKALGLDQGKVYKANLIWRRPGYKSTELQEYYVRPKTTNGYFYKDSNLKECNGCFPLHWFANFMEVGLKVSDLEISHINIDFVESDIFLVENEPKSLNYVQLSLFD
jgi:hypothetical protein